MTDCAVRGRANRVTQAMVANAGTCRSGVNLWSPCHLDLYLLSSFRVPEPNSLCFNEFSWGWIWHAPGTLPGEDFRSLCAFSSSKTISL